MHDALLSRFRGAYLGAALGEQVGAGMAIAAAPVQWQGPLVWTEQILAQTEKCFAPEPLRLAAKPDLHPEQLITCLLPLALLHHDQPLALQQRLAQIAGASDASDLEASPPEFWTALILGQAISLILRERFSPQRLIPQVLQDLDLPDLPAVGLLLSELTTVQTWLEQKVDLAKVARQLAASLASAADQRFRPEQRFGPEALGLVLYCFLSCPADGRTLLRFSRLDSQLQTALPGSSALTGAILGALVGLYGGLPGLPLAWRLGRQAGCGAVSRLSETVLFQQADRLLADWSGVLNADPPPEGLGLPHDQPHYQITAAPRVIQIGG